MHTLALRSARTHATLALAAALLTWASAGEARARDCGGEGQRACCLGERARDQIGGGCERHLREVPSRGGICPGIFRAKAGHCVAKAAPPPRPSAPKPRGRPSGCGREGQRPCGLLEFVPSCEGALVEDPLGTPCRKRSRPTSPSNKPKGRPSGCGREGQRPCGLLEFVPSCEGALVEDPLGTPCRKKTQRSKGRPANCGREGQRPCGLLEFIPSCAGELEERPLGVKCQAKEKSTPMGQCGGAGQRGCCFLEGNRKPGVGAGRCNRGLDEELGAQAKCPGLGHTDIECVIPPPEKECGTNLPFRDLVAGFKHHVHFVQKLEIVPKPPKKIDRDQVTEEAWAQLKEHGWGERLKNSGQSDCLKAKAIAASKRAIDKHIDFWTKNPNAVRGGEVMKTIGDVFCSTIGIGICPLVKFVKSVATFFERLVHNKGDVGKTLLSFWEDFKKDVAERVKNVGAQFEKLFEGFKRFLTIKDEKRFLDEAGKFAETVFLTVRAVTTEFTTFIGLPKLLAELLAAINGGTIAAVLTPPIAGFAAVNLGARKLFEWLLPELVLGIGALGAGATPSVPLLEDFKRIAGIAGTAGGGLIGMLVKDPKKKEQIKAVLERVSGVAGKIEAGLGGVLDLSRKLAAGNFDEVEKALAGAGAKRVPEKFTAEQMSRMIDGLIDFVGDEVWALVNPKLRDLLGKGLSLLDKLLGIPRGAMTGGVGSIPFAGGVLSAALGFGFDVVVGLVKDFLVDKIVMPLVEFIHKDIMEGMKGAFKKRFFAARPQPERAGLARAPEVSPPSSGAPLTEVEQRTRAAVQGSASFRALVGAVGDSVDGVQQTLKTAALEHQRTMSALVMTAMRDVALRGVASRPVRELVTAALHAMAPSFAKPGFTLRAGVGALLRHVEGPLGLLLGGKLGNPRMRQVLREGLAALVRNAQDGDAAARLARHPEGLLQQLSADLIAQVKPQLAQLIVGDHGDPHLKRTVTRELERLSRTVELEGFGALLALPRRLHAVVARTTRTVASRFAAGLEDPVARAAAFQDLEAVAGQVATTMLAPRGVDKALVTVLGETVEERLLGREQAAGSVGGGR